jgi:ABC-type bacteriocin/lantibiotic exporter with double-glycine peptidase domain
MPKITDMADSPPKKTVPKGSAQPGPVGFSFLILLMLLSCAGPSSNLPTKGSRTVDGVPFYPQEEYQCGPASLAGVLSYYGLKVTPAEIAAEIFSRHARGTLDMDMVFCAQKRGMKAEQYSGSIEDLRHNIDSRRPLIVLIDEGFWVYQKSHFMVLVGYGEKSVLVNSGKEEHKVLSQDSFSKTWEGTKFWTLKITPP